MDLMALHLFISSVFCVFIIYNSLIKRAVLLSIQCVSMITEVINYFRHNGSAVCMCLLDASKVFDRVNLLTLFKTLYSGGMCPIYLRLLIKIYEAQKMRIIRWNNAVTDYFTISKDVRFIYGPTHITTQTYWYGLSHEWFIHGSIYICWWHYAIKNHQEQVWLLCWNSVRVFENTWHFVQRFKNKIYDFQELWDS